MTSVASRRWLIWRQIQWMISSTPTKISPSRLLAALATSTSCCASWLQCVTDSTRTCRQDTLYNTASCCWTHSPQFCHLTHTSFCRTMLCISAAYAVTRWLSARLSVSHVRGLGRNEYIYIYISSVFFHHRLAIPYTKRYGNIPTGTLLTGVSNAGGVGKKFSANIWLHCVLWTILLPSAIHTATLNGGKLMTLVAGKRRFMGYDGIRRRSVYDKKPQRYARDNRALYAVVNLKLK